MPIELLPIRSKRKLALLRSRPWESLTEHERLSLLTPETQQFAKMVLGRLATLGFVARLGETWRSPGNQSEAFAAGRSSYSEPAWHSLGKAFHIIVIDPKTKKIDKEAYPVLGKIVRASGGIWKGDVPLKNRFGKVYYDIAHVEYHPGVTLAEARQKQRRAA